MKKIDIINTYIRFEGNLFHFNEKRGNFMTCLKFCGKMVRLGVLGVIPYAIGA